jgi:hypothetical protein
MLHITIAGKYSLNLVSSVDLARKYIRFNTLFIFLGFGAHPFINNSGVLSGKESDIL